MGNMSQDKHGTHRGDFFPMREFFIFSEGPSLLAANLQLKLPENIALQVASGSLGPVGMVTEGHAVEPKGKGNTL